MTADLEATAQALVTPGKGILAVDDTIAAVTNRFEAVRLDSNALTRRLYREMFFTTPGIAQFIGGAVLQEETIYQRNAHGVPLVDLLMRHGIVPGIRVDEGPKALIGSQGEQVTEGLDGLRDRLDEYRALGARFAKWRAVIAVSESLPTPACIHANAHALARFAASCQARGLVPLVEPEVQMDGTHTIERAEQVTGSILRALFDELDVNGVSPEATLLASTMVLPGTECVRQASVGEVAVSTVRCLRRHVPAAVPGVVFLSGCQTHLRATLHLSAINQLGLSKPWTLTFTYGHAWQDEALTAWQGRDEYFKAGQMAFYHRARCNSAASLGQYTSAMECQSVVA